MNDKQFDLLMRMLIIIFSVSIFGKTENVKMQYSEILADFMQYQINRDVDKFVEDPRDGQPISPENL